MTPDPIDILDRLKRGHAGSGVGPLECKEAIDLIERLTAPLTSDLGDLVRELSSGYVEAEREKLNTYIEKHCMADSPSVKHARAIAQGRISQLELDGKKLVQAAAAIEWLAAERDARVTVDQFLTERQRAEAVENERNEAMDMLGDVPGKTLAERLTKYVGEYMGMQVRLKEALEVLRGCRGLLAILTDPASNPNASSMHLWAQAKALETAARGILKETRHHVEG